MIRKFAYIFVLLFASTCVFAQTEVDGSDEYVLEEDDYVLHFDSLEVKDKMHYSFEVGAGFGHSNTYGNYFSTYYKPMVSYDVSPKFSLIGGITYVNSSVNNIPVVTESNYQLFSGNISQYYAFVGGQYKLTDKLTVGGSVFYDFTSYNAFDGTALNAGSGIDNIGYTANFRYKAAKGLTISGEIRMNDKNPYDQYSGRSTSSFFGTSNTFFGR